MNYHRDDLNGNVIDISGKSVLLFICILVFFFDFAPRVAEHGLRSILVNGWCGNDEKCKGSMNAYIK